MQWVQAGVWLLVALVAVLVIFVAGLVWRDGYLRGWRAARKKPPTCPRCGYNLSGLTQCRCPECGATYRLDELWSSAIIRNRSASTNAPAVTSATRESQTT